MCPWNVLWSTVVKLEILEQQRRGYLMYGAKDDYEN